MPKDRILVVVIAVILANLALWTGSMISSLVDEPTNRTYWSYLIADAVAIAGTLWLFRSYRKGRKRAKELERQLEEQGDNHDE